MSIPAKAVNVPGAGIERSFPSYGEKIRAEELRLQDGTRRWALVAYRLDGKRRVLGWA